MAWKCVLLVGKWGGWGHEGEGRGEEEGDGMVCEGVGGFMIIVIVNRRRRRVLFGLGRKG